MKLVFDFPAFAAGFWRCWWRVVVVLLLLAVDEGPVLAAVWALVLFVHSHNLHSTSNKKEMQMKRWKMKCFDEDGATHSFNTQSSNNHQLNLR